MSLKLSWRKIEEEMEQPERRDAICSMMEGTEEGEPVTVAAEAMGGRERRHLQPFTIYKILILDFKLIMYFSLCI